MRMTDKRIVEYCSTSNMGGEELAFDEDQALVSCCRGHDVSRDLGKSSHLQAVTSHIEVTSLASNAEVRTVGRDTGLGLRDGNK